MHTFLKTSFLALAFAASAFAQDLVHKAGPQKAPVVLQNAVLHTVTGGVVLGGTVWFHEGKLRGVLAKGERFRLPDGIAPIAIDCTGKHVFPGLISAQTSLGLIEIGAVRQTDDTDELGESSPEVIAAVALNPDSTAIPVARSNGVLVAAVFPTGGRLPGRVSVMQLDGWTNDEMTVRADAGPVVAWPAQPGERGGGRRGRGGPQAGAEGDPADATKKARARIDDAFAAARAWLDAWVADPSIGVDLRHQALVPALRGEAPVFVLADDLEQIESAVLWANSRKLRPVIVGGRDAASCATMLRDRGVPLILGGVHNLPRREDSAYDEAFTLPKRLADAGVQFCIATGSDFSNDRQLPYHAATAVAHGLAPDRALATITNDAAAILGVGDRLGSLTVGKDATLFIADGHPFELTTTIERAFVQGREIDLRNKQTELAKKYRERYRQHATK